MGYFMHIRDQKAPGVQVRIDGNLCLTSRQHPEITQPGPTGPYHPEDESVCLMKLPAIGCGRCRNECNELICQGIKTKKAL
jgi:hypothetical protein